MKVKAVKGVVVLIGVMVGSLIFFWLWPSNEPVYQGKSVSEWFEEYVSGPFATNGSSIVLVRDRTGGVMISKTKPPKGTYAYVSGGGYEAFHTPARDGLLALGPKAIPYLLTQVHVRNWESPYRMLFTNLPPFAQRQLPNPSVTSWRRYRALDALNELRGFGNEKEAVLRALLEALKHPDPTLQNNVCLILRFHYERRALLPVMFGLGSEHRQQEALKIAQALDLSREELALLINKILPDSMCIGWAEVLMKLEEPKAAIAVEQMVGVLKDPNASSVLRYLAACSLKEVGSNTPSVIAALRASLSDTNDLVRDAAWRALQTYEPRRR